MTKPGTVTRRAALVAGGVAFAQGEQPRRIDIQSHLFCPELLEFMQKRRTSPSVYTRNGETFVVVNDWVRKVLPKHTDVPAKVRDMDAAGIQKACISINDPGPELFAGDGPAIATMVNDYIAKVCRKYPDRFVGVAVLPLQDAKAAAREMDRCLTTLGMKGILLYSNIAGVFPDEPQFRFVFERAEAAKAPVLLHPAYPTTYAATSGFEMAAGLGLMFDTTIALTRLILAGVLERHPALKLVCPHVGGALPYLIGRIDHQTQVLKRGADRIRKAPSEYLRNVYLDTVTPIAMAIRYAHDFVGSDRLLYATDHPWVDPQLISANVASLAFGKEVESKIYRSNAEKLFNL